MKLPSTVRLGEIAISLMGIWFAVQALVTIGTWLSFYLEVQARTFPTSQFFPPGVYFFSGAFLLVFRRRLAGELFASSEEHEGSTDNESAELQEFAVSVLGIWILVFALSFGVSTEMNLLTAPSPDEFESLFGENRARTMIRAEAWAARLPYLTELLCGGVLFASSGRIVRLWRNLRAAGRIR